MPTEPVEKLPIKIDEKQIVDNAVELVGIMFDFKIQTNFIDLKISRFAKKLILKKQMSTQVNLPLKFNIPTSHFRYLVQGVSLNNRVQLYAPNRIKAFCRFVICAQLSKMITLRSFIWLSVIIANFCSVKSELAWVSFRGI
jgi:hypothetical protein